MLRETKSGAFVAPELPADQAERFARARSKSVMICTPVARAPVRQYTLSILDTMLTLERAGIRCSLQWVVGNSNLPRARNELVAEFLASDCTDLLWIDDDMGWKAGDVIRLLASDQEFIGGVGRKKTPDTSDHALETWCCRLFLDRPVRQDEMGAIEVQGIGTGFLKISRRVFDAVAAAQPELKRPGLASMPPAVRARFYSFFRFLDEPGHPMMSEDIAFCESWRRLGGTVWADPEIELVHVGDREFTGTFASLLVARSEAA
jgi:hypothetical protein